MTPHGDVTTIKYPIYLQRIFSKKPEPYCCSDRQANGNNNEFRVKGVVLEGSRTTSEVTAQLPNLRAYGTYMITDRWEVSVTGGWLSFDYEDYAGDYLYLIALRNIELPKALAWACLTSLPRL